MDPHHLALLANQHALQRGPLPRELAQKRLTPARLRRPKTKNFLTRHPQMVYYAASRSNVMPNCSPARSPSIAAVCARSALSIDRAVFPGRPRCVCEVSWIGPHRVEIAVAVSAVRPAVYDPLPASA